MKQALSAESMQQIFTQARTNKGWTTQPVTDEKLKEIYNLMKWGPTSVNSNPMRILFVRSPEAKSKLLPCLAGSNVAQVAEAPVTAVIAYDEKFFELLPRLMPAFDARAGFVDNKPLIDITAMRNSSIQGAYFIVAARALGLDIGAMSGFDNAMVDETFFKATTWRSNFLCNIGYADPSKNYPRGPRLEFNEACKIV